MPLKNQTDPLPISLVLAFLFELGAGTLFKVFKLPSLPLPPYWHCEFS